MKFSSALLLLSMATFVNARNAYPAPNDATCIVQDDFATGTLVLTEPNSVYKLCEDISFLPLGPAAADELPAGDAFNPTSFDSEVYTENGYGLGFFSAIAVAAPGVTIHLDGYTIEQSAEHALMQRFFAVIELASSPFIPGAGPAQFVGSEGFDVASNVEILGPGTIGRSSHHGIHGNDNTNVKIAAIDFQDFEVAAVSVNNVDNLEISNCDIVRNRQDVPIVGLFSAARFILPYGKFLKDQGYETEMYNSKTGITETVTAADAYNKLLASINNVYHDVIMNPGGMIDEDAHPEEHQLFDNPFRVVDGPCYAFLIHGKGPAVFGQGEHFNDENEAVTSSNVVIKGNSIKNMKCWNNEVPALIGPCGNHGCVTNDVRGSIFQLIKTFGDDPYLALGPDGKYNGNVVSNMQIMVAKAILDENFDFPSIPSRQLGPNSIGGTVTDWATDGSELTPEFVCNGDSMHHTIKGTVVMRIEDTRGYRIEKNDISDVENLSIAPFSSRSIPFGTGQVTSCKQYHAAASFENIDEYQAGNIRMISVAAVRGYDGRADSLIKNNKIGGASSAQANVVIGIDVQGDSSHTDIAANRVDLRESIFASDKLIALRIREAADKSINVRSNNSFAQDTQILNTAAMRGRRGRNLMKGHPRVSGDIEWKHGGCPMMLNTEA